jgi:penicillin-binding protein 1A
MAIVGLTLTGLILFCVLLLVTPSADQATAIVRTRADQHGVPYPGTRPPRRFAQALIATEDQRFNSAFDVGIDPFAAAKIIIKSIIEGQGDQGGSTIDQQLAKMLYTPGQSGHFLVDLLQVALAVKLHLSYSNEAILQMYAEVAYFGSGYYGLDAASHGYFGRAPADLTWGQSAMLAGIVNAPSRDDPRTKPANALARQAHVFHRLVAVGELTKAEADHEMLRPVGLVSP